MAFDLWLQTPGLQLTVFSGDTPAEQASLCHEPREIKTFDHMHFTGN